MNYLKSIDDYGKELYDIIDYDLFTDLFERNIKISENTKVFVNELSGVYKIRIMPSSAFSADAAGLQLIINSNISICFYELDDDYYLVADDVIGKYYKCDTLEGLKQCIDDIVKEYGS